MSDEEGYWIVYYRPELSASGEWVIRQENTKTKEVTLLPYESEEQANAVYHDFVMSKFRGAGKH